MKVDGNWRTNPEWFKHRSEDVGLPAGCINLSPAWFQQGHEVGFDRMMISVVEHTNPIESSGPGGICIIKGTIVRGNPKCHCKAGSHRISGTQDHASGAVLGRVTNIFKPRRKGRKQGTAKNVRDPAVLGIRV